MSALKVGDYVSFGNTRHSYGQIAEYKKDKGTYMINACYGILIEKDTRKVKMSSQEKFIESSHWVFSNEPITNL